MVQFERMVQQQRVVQHRAVVQLYAGGWRESNYKSLSHPLAFVCLLDTTHTCCQR